MADVLTVGQARDKILELVEAEANLDYKDRTKITVKGEVSAVDPVRDDRFQNVYLREIAPDRPLFLQISRYDLQRKDGQPWNRTLTKADIGSEQTFTGIAREYQGQAFLSAMLGDGTRTRPGGGGGYQNPRLEMVRILFDRGMASFAPMAFSNGDWKSNVVELGGRVDCVLQTITPGRVDTLLARANLAQAKKPETKTEKPEEQPSDDDPSPFDPFEGD